MIPISELAATRPQLPTAITSAERSAQKEPTPPRQPDMDEYIPEEKQSPTGLYWPEYDENGDLRIHSDAPESPDPKPETTRGSTDIVDREIENLKKEKQKLEQQLSRETDETARKDLERRLSQIENELRMKDNDAYRRQHTVFS